MKKLSKPGKQMPEETIGIDLGDKMSRYCIVNREGEVIEEGSFRNQASSLAKHFSGGPRRIALEAGAQSAWISRELKGLGHEVIVANARELKWITASDTKNDSADARKLALLARADVQLLAPVEHRTAEQQAQLAQAEPERCARSTVRDRQERRSVLAQVVGAVCTSRPRALGQGLGAAPMGLDENRRRKESYAARDCRRGPKTIRTAAPLMGERRVLPTLS